MKKPLVDASNVGEGLLDINTRAVTSRIPNPIIKALVEQIQKIVANSGYANVTVVINATPTLAEVTERGGKVIVRFPDSSSRLKGPVIEITTANRRFSGVFTVALLKDGVRVQTLPPADLLTQVRKILNKKAPILPAANGYEEGPQSYGQDSRGYRQVPQGYGEAADGYGQAPNGYGQIPRGYGQNPQQDFDQQRQGGNFYSSYADQPPKPVLAQRKATAPRAQVPVTAYSQNGRGQPQSGFLNQPQRTHRQAQSGIGRPPGQPQGFDNNSDGEKGGGGCCFGGGSESEGGSRGRNPKGAPQSTYNNLSGGTNANKNFAKEQHKKNEKERKKAEKKRKKQQKKRQHGKESNYGNSGGQYQEKSAFDDDRNKSGGGCFSCCSCQ